MTGRCSITSLIGKIAFVTVAMSANVISAWAAQDDIRFNAVAGLLYDSNRELRSDSSEELNGAILRATGRYTRSTERTQWEAGLRWVDEYFPDFRDQENDRAVLALTGVTRWERSRLNTSLDLTRDTSLATEVQTSGVAQQRKDRVRTALTANYEYSLSEIDQLILGGSAETVDYENIIPGQLAEYDYYGVNVGYGRALRQTSRLQMFAFENRLRNETDGYENDVQGVKLAWTENLSETSNLKLSAGQRISRFRQDVLLLGVIDGQLQFVPFQYEQEDKGTLYELEWTYQGYLVRSSLSGNWDLAPSSSGNLVDRKRLTSTTFLPWTASVSSVVNLSYWEQISEVARLGSDDTRGHLIGVSLNWQLDRKFYAVFRLQRLERELIHRDETAWSNQVVMEIAWMEDPFFL